MSSKKITGVVDLIYFNCNRNNEKMEWWNDGQFALILNDFINFQPNFPLFQNSNIPCTIIEGLTVRDNIVAKFAFSRIK
jgi:hypothetical protein